MRQPMKTFLLVRAKLDENEVPYLVANPAMPSRKVGIRRVEKAPEKPGHFAEHFEPHAHVIEVSNLIHLAHYRSEAASGTLEILGQVQARDLHEATQKLQPPAPPAQEEPTTKPTGAAPAAPAPTAHSHTAAPLAAPPQASQPPAPLAPATKDAAPAASV